ncbi:hypothetical protein TI05_00320 [Achromatium sp. WMS3]|nr:hypothetical protein TI05_00320 [Achromatium sp. WMS3]
MWILIGINIISLISNLLQMDLLASGYISEGAAEINDNRQLFIGITFSIVYIITGIMFLRWVHLLNKNCHGFGTQDMKFTPGWAIGYYFVPLLNLYKPYQAMQEIWKVSTNPINWQNQNGSTLIGWWWTLFLISNLLINISFRMSMSSESIDNLQVATTISILGELIDIPAYFIVLAFIRAIYAKQKALVKRNVF